MSKIVLFDKSEFIISKTQTAQLERALAQSTDGFVTVDGRTIKKNAIAAILPGGETEVDIPKPWANQDRQIVAGKVCKAEYSIQNEINMIAKTYADWSKRIVSEKWREGVRKKLREQTEQWCDYREGTCACEAKK